MTVKIGVYICHCGSNIAGTVDVKQVAEYAATLDSVVVARHHLYMCSDQGQELIKNDIKELGLNRVVVASCSPRMHELTFRNACREGGLNPYLYEQVNIREHCSWVHKDRDAATEKAKNLVRAGVRRVYHQEPLEVKEAPVNPNTLIVGGGIAGISAALKIAASGKKVYLVEREPSIGGHMSQLDITFPTLDCSECILTPKMTDVGSSPYIELMTYSEVEEVSGYIGNFKIKIRKKARYIDADKCNSCNVCLDSCPVRYIPQVEQAMKETSGKPVPRRESEKPPKPNQKSEVKRNEVSLEIDGREVKAEEGTTILEAAKSAGIDIPTLCYHPALAPVGACRLCSVEITSQGRRRIVTSCNYPVEDGLIVSTSAPDVIKIRKMLCELLLARCPNVKVIQDLAQEYGVEKPRFELEEEKCICCGLCTRVCGERMGISNIGFVGRGIDRNIATPFQMTQEVNFDTCMACGACAFVCPTGAIKLEDITSKKPVPLLSEFDVGLKSRAPVYIPFAQAVPNVPVIDRETCVHFAADRCKICEELCPTDAINFEQEDEIVEVEVGSIIVATGFDAFDPSVISEYGYGRYDNVITALEFERLSCAGGPTGGEILLKDGRKPESVAIIHCVGSRDQNYHEYCSRVCCMYALKDAYLIREKTGAEVYEMYIDMRCFGEGYEEFYKRLSEEGICFIRGKPAEVTDQALTEEEKGKLTVICEDTLLGSMLRVPVDMVILCIAIEPRSDAEQVARLFNISRRPDGFFQERHLKLDPVATPTRGVFIVGCCEGPRDISDTVAQAMAGAAEALALIGRGSVTLEAAVATVNTDICIGCGRCREACEFHAIEIVKDERAVPVSQVNEVLCQGCGACAVACPTGAMSIRHFTDEQILSMVSALVEA